MLAVLRLKLILLCGLATLVSLAAQETALVTAQEAQGELAAFQRKSARELLQQHFHGPPFPLFVIRRLIELGDPLVIPTLEGAFAQETSEITRQFLAAALVSLGDPDPQYYNYVANAAATAVATIYVSCGLVAPKHRILLLPHGRLHFLGPATRG